MMKRQEELNRMLTDLIRATREQKIRWSVEVETTEANDPEQKPVEKEDGVPWTVDECYVSYYCKYKGREFCMITYELIKTSGERVLSGNMVFLPPLGVRYFDLHTLLPYSVDTSKVLLDQVHRLFMMLLDIHKADPAGIYFDIRPRKLTIED